MKKQYLEAGEFVTTHGVTGELRLYPWGDGPEFLAGFSRLYLDAEGRQPLEIEAIRPHKNLCLVRLAGVESVADARPFIGRTVYISRQDAALPEGRYFVQDLLGAVLRREAGGEVLGRVVNVSRPGRHDVWEVEHPDGRRSLFPAVEPYLVRLDIEAGEALVAPIEGMLEGDAPLPKPNPNKGKKP